jgi:hypothetical protein
MSGLSTACRSRLRPFLHRKRVPYANGEVSRAGVASIVTLKLSAGVNARNITYLDSRSWSQDQLLLGQNGIAALTFCDVAVLPMRPLAR